LKSKNALDEHQVRQRFREGVMPTILVADDSPTMRRMVMAVLGRLPRVRFAEAGSGLEAIEQLTLQPVDLVVLDLNMPDMHGLDVLRFVRAQPGYQALPILVLTTRDSEGSREEALAAGASRYLTKPFAPEELARHVQELLGSARLG
jgi:two-component system chemotaxis response regulator CheY